MKRTRAWLHETHGPVIELARHFFLGLFRSESFAGSDSFTTWVVQILGLLIAASWFLPVLLFQRYLELNAEPDGAPYRLAYSTDCFWILTLMMLLMAFVTVAEWPALFPSQRDHLVLAPLPLRRTQIFAGKLLALFLFFSLFLLAITLLTSVTLPFVAASRWEERNTFLKMFALFVAAAGSGYFTFLALLGLQGLLLMILPARWFPPVSFGVQCTLLLLLLCAVPVLPHLPAKELVTARAGSGVNTIDWLPPAWFWAVGERLTGTHDAAIVRLSQRAGIGFEVALAVSATAYLFTYLNQARHAMESGKRLSAPLFTPAEWLSAMFADPEARAISSFVTNTLMRGRQQKLVFLLIAGSGAALIFENALYLALQVGGHREAIEIMVLSLPMTLSLFTFIALRRVFRIPIDYSANWIFRLLDNAPARSLQLDAVFGTFVIIGGFLPLLLCTPIEVYVFGWRAAAALTAQALLMVLCAEYLLLNWRSVPFTCAQEAEQRHFVHSLCVHLIELTVYSFTSAEWIRAGLGKPLDYCLLMLSAVTVLAWLHRWRTREWGKEPLAFLELAPQPVEALRFTPE